MFIDRRGFIGKAAGCGIVAAVAATPSLASPGGVYSSITSFGGSPGGADNTSAFNAALASGVRNLYFPAGQWFFNSKPNTITNTLEISGEGQGVSTLVRNYAESALDVGFLTIHALNVRIAQIGVIAGNGTSQGVGIRVFADDTAVCGFNILEDIYVSHIGSGRWAHAISVDGSSRSADPLGVRDIQLRNCNLFSCSHSACKISGGVAVSITGGGMFLGNGLSSRLMVTGTPTVNSYYVNADVPIIGGLYLDNCQSVNIKAGIIAGDITNANTAQDILVLGRCTGQVTQYWTRGKLIDPAL